MEDKKTLGIYWGKDFLYFIEASPVTSPKKIFCLPFQEEKSQSFDGITLIPADPQLPFLIQDSVRKHKITSSVVNLSLPTKDIIFRSFVIPWMQPNEIKGVVDFEASKYIPFPLEELSYTFHPLTFTEDNAKKMRIIFVAIKKDTLENYSNILSHANLSVDVIEPSFLSLIRVLSLKNNIPLDQTTAIVEKGENIGKIIIVDQGVPQFVREFQFSIAQTGMKGIDPKVMATRLVNEIRISFDYFSRQEAVLKVKKIFFLTATDSGPLPKILEEDLGISTVGVNCQTILGNNSVDQIGYLSAYGVGVFGSTNSAVNFDLAMDKPQSFSGGGASSQGFKYKIEAIMAAVLLPLILGAFIFSFNTLRSPKDQLNDLRQKLGTFQTAETEKIKEKTVSLMTKFDNFKKVPLKSNVTLLLKTTPALLPEGVWLKSLDINYLYIPTKDATKQSTTPGSTEPRANIELNGYSYIENTKGQVLLVNRFRSNLKQSQDFAQFFTDIDLETVRIEKVDQYTVTSFRIRGQQ